MSEKKKWFRAYHRQLWVPISIEGVAIMLAYFAAIFFVLRFNNFEALLANEAEFWPPILELLAVTGLYYWSIRNRVDKRH